MELKSFRLSRRSFLVLLTFWFLRSFVVSNWKRVYGCWFLEPFHIVTGVVLLQRRWNTCGVSFSHRFLRFWGFLSTRIWFRSMVSGFAATKSKQKYQWLLKVGALNQRYGLALYCRVHEYGILDPKKRPLPVILAFIDIIAFNFRTLAFHGINITFRPLWCLLRDCCYSINCA